MMWRVLQRVGAVLALVLALLVLGADSGEYPALTLAGVRALIRDLSPLLVVAGLNLAALDGRRLVQLFACIANIFYLGSVLTLARKGAPPFVWMSFVVAAILTISSGMRIAKSAGPVDGASNRGAGSA